MLKRNRPNYETRKQIDAHTTNTNPLDTTTPAIELYEIAADAIAEGRTDDAMRILATIPPVVLGKTVYRVTGVRRDRGTEGVRVGTGVVHELYLVGPRGGASMLLRAMGRRGDSPGRTWAHIALSGTGRSADYNTEDLRTFERV